MFFILFLINTIILQIHNTIGRFSCQSFCFHSFILYFLRLKACIFPFFHIELFLLL